MQVVGPSSDKLSMYSIGVLRLTRNFVGRRVISKPLPYLYSAYRRLTGYALFNEDIKKIAITPMLVHQKLLAKFALAADVVARVATIVVEITAALCEGWLAVLFESTLDLPPNDALVVGSELVEALTVGSAVVAVRLALEGFRVDVGNNSEPP